MNGKPWYASKTLWANAALFAVAAIGLVLDMSAALALPERWGVYLTLAAGLINLALRMTTSRPIARRRKRGPA